jgi:chemotaxis response regulator CheB
MNPMDEERFTQRTIGGPSAPPELVVIAASADGLRAIGGVVGVLPATFPVPLAVVLHRFGDSVLAKILARRCALRVKDAEEGETPVAGTVYLAPPRYHLVLRPDRTFHLMDGRMIKHLHSSANPLFESAAQSLNGRVVAVVLTGSGTDATDGVQTVKAMGGTVIVQDPVETAFGGMPRSAIRTGAVDMILPLEQIPIALLRLVAGETAAV